MKKIKKPLLEKWIVPEGYEIMYKYKDHYYGHNKVKGYACRWKCDNGKSVTPGVVDLIPGKADIKIDDPVIVWDSSTDEKKRYFAGWSKWRKIKTWAKGSTKWSSGGGTTTWDNYRLPTSEDK